MIKLNQYHIPLEDQNLFGESTFGVVGYFVSFSFDHRQMGEDKDLNHV